MHTKLNDQIRKVLFRLMLGGIALFLSLGASGSPVAHAQEAWAHEPGAYYTVTTITLPDGTIIEEDNINGPPVPPPGFEVERQPVSLPEADSAAGINTLTVPAFNWVFGCSAVSGAMIAGYYDRSGWSNIYTGPTNGGVMPLDNSSWPTWSDGFATYPSCPLIASKNGVDGRTTRGSIDDYWVKYNSTADDPYITNGWTQHTWGDAIGDYMFTSQSAFDNVDGSTNFWNWISLPTPLNCDVMASYGIDNDGTLGRKHFYEARGYTVTDCYNQKTDNTIAGGFSFVQFKAEIDAGRPVMLNFAGHTVVGVGYDDSSNLVYIHDTWDYNNHTMTWGGSYSGMALQSVSIVNIQGQQQPSGTIQLSAATYSVNENGVSVTITATRTNGSSGAVGVSYATSNGTATAGSDYTATSGTLSWANGDTSNKTFSVPILDDSAYEGNETVNLTLSSPTGGATLGSPSTAVLTIIDNDLPFPAEIIGTWSSGIWYYNVENSNWTKMYPSAPIGPIAVGDVTGDGKADVISCWASGLWYQNGDTLGWTKVYGGTNPSYLAAGDITGDGRAEIVGTWSSGIWYYNLANSTWTKMYPSAPIGPIAVGDVTGDGQADVISCWASGLWFQDGATLGLTKVYSVAPSKIAVGDITGN